MGKHYLSTWCKELTHWKRPWCWERLEAGGEGRQRVRRLDGITDSVDMSLSKLQEIVKSGKPRLLQSMGSQRVGHDWATEQVPFLMCCWPCGCFFSSFHNTHLTSPGDVWPGGKFMFGSTCYCSMESPAVFCPREHVCEWLKRESLWQLGNMHTEALLGSKRKGTFP